MDMKKLQDAEQALMPFIKAQGAAKDLGEVIAAVRQGLQELAEAEESLKKVKREAAAAAAARDEAQAALAKAKSDLVGISAEFKQVQEAIRKLSGKV